MAQSSLSTGSRSHLLDELGTSKVGALGDIDIETCGECGGPVKVIACIQDPEVIDKILTHLQEKLAPVPMANTQRGEPGCRLA